ncbi:MAG: hypothetical protein ABFE13_00795 [Phycisphaerales bacterium]
MAVYTPRGLKIRLDQAYAFALMARLFPHIDAFRVLQLTEEVENLASLATFIAAIAAFAAQLDPVMTGIVVGTTHFSFRMAHLFGLFVPPFRLLLPLSHIYSWLAGYGIFLIMLLALGYFMVGWEGLVAFTVARVAAGWLAGGIDLAYARFIFKKTGAMITASERSFFHAYRLSADQLGITRSIEVDEEEMKPANWQHVHADMTIKWPVVAARFTPD